MSRTDFESTKIHNGTWRVTTTSMGYDPNNYPNRIMITTSSYSQNALYKLYEKRSGSTTPFYGKKLDNGQNIGQNSFSFVKRTEMYPYQRSFSFGKDYISTETGPVVGYYYKADTDFSSAISPILRANQRNAAIIQLRGRLKEMSVNVAQAYAERDRSIQLVGDSLMKLVKAALAVKRGNIKDALGMLPGRVSRGVAGKVIQRVKAEGAGAAFGRNWLEIQYGWRPLVQDVFGACEALGRIREKKPLLKAVGKTSRSYDSSRTVSESAYRTLDYTTKIRRDHKFTAYVKVNDGGAHDLASLGLTNPAMIAWELMPWSFVVDWVVPIGPWIEGMDAMIGLDFVSCSETIFYEGKSSLYNKYKRVTRNGDGSESSVTDIQESSFEEVSCERTALASVPVAYFPYVKNPMSGQHVANALALLLAGFAGKK